MTVAVRAEGSRTGAIALPLGVLAMLVAGCTPQVYKVDRPQCRNHVMHESPSPGGNAKAVVFERECMTTTTIQVSILPKDGHVSSEPGNTFAVGAGKGSTQGRPTVSVAWSGSNRLTVSYTKGAAVMHGEGRVGSIDVRYAFVGEEAPVANAAPPARGAR